MRIIYFKKIQLACCITVVLLFGLMKPATAQKTEELKELLQVFFSGETVYPQAKNEVQLTTLPAFWKTKNTRTTTATSEIEYGVSKRFTVEVELPYSFIHQAGNQSVHGAGNMEIGLLYNIVNSNKSFALSAAMDIELPAKKEQKGIAEPELEWEPYLVAAKQFGRMQVHAAVAAEITKNETAFNYKLSTVFPFGDWRATLELNGKFNNEKIIYLTPGLVWKGLNDFEFGLGFSRTITGNAGERGFIFMITHEFSLSKTKQQHR